MSAPAVALAQVPTYVSAGLTLERRSTPDSDSERLSPLGMTFALGWPVGSRLGMEISAGRSAATRTDWFFGYLFASRGDKRTVERDIPVTFAFRLPQPCLGRICHDFVVGWGLNIHRSMTTTLTDCGHVSAPIVPCREINTPGVMESHMEATAMLGIDVRVPLRNRLSLAPQARVYFTDRTDYLTGYVHRGPKESGPVRGSAGLTAIMTFGR